MNESLLITGGFRCIIRVLEFISYFLSSPDLLFLLSFFLPHTPNVDNCQDRVAKLTQEYMERVLILKCPKMLPVQAEGLIA